MCFNDNSPAMRMMIIRRRRILMRLDEVELLVTVFSSFTMTLDDSEWDSEERPADEDTCVSDSLFCVLRARTADLRPLIVVSPFVWIRISPAPSWKSK